jgi:cell division transport system permease protein
MITFLKKTFINHLRNIIATLGNLYRKPLTSIITIFIIGVTLSLPLLGFMVIKTLDQARDILSQQLTIHVYLKNNLSQNQLISLQQQINELGPITSITFVSKAQSLASLDQKFSELLSDNPLPDMLVLSVNNPQSITKALTNKIESLSGVDLIASDISWINNYTKIITTIKIITLVFGSLILITMSMIIVNTIKLLLERQREQIKINRLVGATFSFILREFMYYGFWYGLLGAVLAIILATSCALVIKLTISKILTDSLVLPYYLLNLKNSAIIMGTASLLGTISAAFSITAQLRKLEY